MLIQLKKLQRGYKKKILRGKAFSQAGRIFDILQGW